MSQGSRREAHNTNPMKSEIQTSGEEETHTSSDPLSAGSHFQIKETTEREPLDGNQRTRNPLNKETTEHGVVYLAPGCLLGAGVCSWLRVAWTLCHTRGQIKL